MTNCPNCGAARSPEAVSCSYCGTVFPKPQPPKRVRRISGVGLKLGTVTDAIVSGTGIKIQRAIRCHISGVGIKVKSACPDTIVTGTGCRVDKVEP